MDEKCTAIRLQIQNPVSSIGPFTRRALCAVSPSAVLMAPKPIGEPHYRHSGHQLRSLSNFGSFGRRTLKPSGQSSLAGNRLDMKMLGNSSNGSHRCGSGRRMSSRSPVTDLVEAARFRVKRLTYPARSKESKPMAFICEGSASPQSDRPSPVAVQDDLRCGTSNLVIR